jgi:hypothetical protein
MTIYRMITSGAVASGAPAPFTAAGSSAGLATPRFLDGKDEGRCHLSHLKHFLRQ